MTTKNELGVEVGAFFYCSWGYDQTNVDWYKVVGVTAKGVKVQAWKSKVEDGHVVPGDGVVTHQHWVDNPGEGAGRVLSDPVEAPVKFHRTRPWSSEPTFTVNSYSNAYLWDGQPKYETHAAGQPGH